MKGLVYTRGDLVLEKKYAGLLGAGFKPAVKLWEITSVCKDGTLHCLGYTSTEHRNLAQGPVAKDFKAKKVRPFLRYIGSPRAGAEACVCARYESGYVSHFPSKERVAVLEYDGLRARIKPLGDSDADSAYSVNHCGVIASIFLEPYGSGEPPEFRPGDQVRVMHGHMKDSLGEVAGFSPENGGELYVRFAGPAGISFSLPYFPGELMKPEVLDESIALCSEDKILDTLDLCLMPLG